MTERHYYVPTTDAHVAVWFYVRSYSNGATEVETVVENGWLQVASPGQKDYTVTVSVGGTTRYTGTIAHYHHTRWSRVDWVGTDPAITPTHDTQYLQQTNLVPTIATTTCTSYAAHPAAGTKFSAYTRLQGYQPTPFDRANIDPSLGSGGDSDNYGLLAVWGHTYLTEANSGAFYSVLANARAAGRFAIHYRDESTGRVVRGSSHSTLGYNDTLVGIAYNAGNLPLLTPAPTGLNNTPSYPHSHAPTMGFLAYLLEGRWLFLDEAQFEAASADMLQSKRTLTDFPDYRFMPYYAQVRSQAGDFRVKVQALSIVPQYIAGTAVTGAEADQLTEATGRVSAFIEHSHKSHILGTTGTAVLDSVANNIFGIWYSATDYSDYLNTGNDGQHEIGGAMQSLMVTTVCYAYDLDLPLDATTAARLAALAAFVARHPVGMLGAASGGTTFDWRIPSWYQLAFSTPGSGASDVWRASWDAQWTHMTTYYQWSGGNPFPIAADNKLRSAYPGTGATTPAYAMILGAAQDDLNTSSTPLYTFMASIAYAHKIADRVTIPGIDLAASRFYGSDSWTASIAAAFPSNPRVAVTTDRPVA